MKGGNQCGVTTISLGRLQYIYEYIVSSDVVLTQHVTRHNTPIHNTLSTAPQLSISQKGLGTLPEGGNVMAKHVGVTIHN
jgi:hypothetical protein